MNIGDKGFVKFAGRTEVVQVIGFDLGQVVVRMGNDPFYLNFRDSEITPLEPDCTVPEGLEVAA